MGNEKKAETLGMPHGTANGKLWRLLLFKYICIAGEDNCFRCKEKILTAQDMSIEHKLPWEGISAELFWDLENIAFSHRKCNRPHRNGAIKLRVKEGKEDEAWCTGCKEFHKKSEFHRLNGRWNGSKGYCKRFRSDAGKARRRAGIFYKS